MRLRLFLSIAAIALAVAGCSAVLPGSGEPARMYTLTPKTTFSPDLPRADWQLTVDQPISEAGLNTTRIALRHSPVTLEYFARAEWVDKAPVVVQKLLVESFEATGKIVAVARQSVSLRSDYNLLCELREFQAEYDGGGPPSAHVRLIVKLVKMPDRVIVGSYSADFTERAASGEMERIVEAFDVALGKALKRIVEWTLMTAAEVQRTAPRD
jgi:cholesterol transport system auxiliary component